MKKLVLNIEDLEVASFEAAPASEARGTVQGNMAVAASYYWFCFGSLVCSATCPPE